MAVKFGSILEPNNPNTTAIAKTVHLSGARSVPTYADLNNIIPTVLSPSFDPATGTIDTKDAIGQVWYVANENKYYRLSNIRITGDKPPFTPVTSWENFATSVVASQEQWIHDYIASGISTQSIIGYNPQSGSSTANNIYFTDANQIKFLTGGKYFKLDSSNGSDDVDNPALIVTESTLNSKVDTIYTADINPLWGSVEDIVKYINTDIAGYINDLYSKVGTVTANATWSGIIGDKTTQSGNLPKGTVKAIVGDTNDYVVQFGTNQVDLQNVIRDDNNNELSRANILVGKNAVTKKQQAIVYTTSRDVSTNKIVSMDELTINPNSIYLGNQDTTTFTARDNLTITPGAISMYAGSNMNIQLGTKSENHNINIIPDSTNALYGATFTNLPLNVETLNFKNGTTLTSFNTAVNDIIDTKVYTRNINITNKSRILTTIDPGELVVYHATSSNGFIVRTKPATGNLYQLQLLSTNGYQSYQYNFPLTGGTVALESYVDTQITNLSTNFTNIVGNLQEQITDNYDELDGKITDVNARVDTTNANLATTNANLATTNTNLSNHEKKIATVSEYGHVMLGTKAVISNNFVCIGTHTNGSLVFAIDTALNATSSQPLKNSVITAELAKKATIDALTTGLATKVDKDMTSVTGREMVVQLANGTDTMSGLGIHDGNVMAIGNGIGDAVVANGLGVDVATGTSYLYSDNTEYNLTELVKTTIPGIQNTLATKADSTTLTTELAKKADKATTLAGYGITDAYTKTATDTALAKKADKATTLAGYGITDAYTKTATDTALAKKVDTTTLTTELAKKADKATTLAGYGITDTYTKTELDGKLVGAMRFKGNVDTYNDLPSTGQVHGDMWNVLDTGDNYAWNSDTSTWDNLAGVINLADYAKTTDVTSAISTAVSNHNSSSSAHSTLFATKANKATTLAGYGITDAYTKTTVDTALAKKANSATTLEGYGITDAYTSEEVDTELAKKATTDALTTGLAAKADKATTLAGYGITDALSKTVTTQQTVAGSVKVNNTFYATTIYENNTSLANKYAAKSHIHAISDVTNLQTTLDSKASTTDVETLTNNLATEVSDRETADTNLQTSITTNATNITTLQGKVTTLETNALSKTATAQQSVASEVKFNGGIRADSIKTLYGTSLFTTVSAKGFDFTGIYRMFPYQSTEAFFESTVAGGSNTLLRATTIYENGVSLADTYAKKADVYTKTETDSAIVAVISNKNKSVWSPEFTTTDYDSTEEAYKWIIGVYTIPEYSNELPIVQIYEDSSATGTPTPTGATKLELVQPKIAVTYDSTGTKAAVTAYFNFESADLPIVAYRYKAQIWFPGMSVTTETGGYPISNVKVKVLTQAEYDAITEKDEDTIYFISDAE